MTDILATMYTSTTYGTWLRGDARGWTDQGRTWPPNPILEAADRTRMKHDPFLFRCDQFLAIGDRIGRELIKRLELHILAMTVQAWHVHFVVAATTVKPPKIAKCAKDAGRWHLRPGRPIWTEKYDKRFCFTLEEVRNRIAYVEQHNTQIGLPARPWDFIEPLCFGDLGHD